MTTEPPRTLLSLARGRAVENERGRAGWIPIDDPLDLDHYRGISSNAPSRRTLTLHDATDTSGTC